MYEGIYEPKTESKEKINFRIILAEDEEVARTSLEFWLRTEYPKTESVANAEDLIKKFAADPNCDLVIGDNEMPVDNKMHVMTGLEALKKIREKNPSVSAILITARLEVKIQKEAEEAGIVCLEKPFAIQDLEREVEKIRTKSLNKPIP